MKNKYSKFISFKNKNKRKINIKEMLNINYNISQGSSID